MSGADYAPLGDVPPRRRVRAIAGDPSRSVLAVEQAAGAELGDDVITEILVRLRNAPPDIDTSMLGDREARRPLKFDTRNGVILRIVRRHRPAGASQRGNRAAARRG